MPDPTWTDELGHVSDVTDELLMKWWAKLSPVEKSSVAWSVRTIDPPLTPAAMLQDLQRVYGRNGDTVLLMPIDILRDLIDAELREGREAREVLAEELTRKCVGEWVGGSGGHRRFAGCGKRADFAEIGGQVAFCEQHVPRRPLPETEENDG
jgi:hypothetical protein